MLLIMAQIPFFSLRGSDKGERDREKGGNGSVCCTTDVVKSAICSLNGIGSCILVHKV